jgi:hypothetical protein
MPRIRTVQRCATRKRYARRKNGKDNLSLTGGFPGIYEQVQLATITRLLRKAKEKSIFMALSQSPPVRGKQQIFV